MKLYILLFGMFVGLLHIQLVSPFLPRNYVPPHYDVHLAIDIQQTTFKGLIDITIIPKVYTSELLFKTTFEIDQIRIREKSTMNSTIGKMVKLDAKKWQCGDKCGDRLNVTDIVYSDKDGTANVILGGLMSANTEYVVSIIYRSGTVFDSEASFLWLKEDPNPEYSTAVLQVLSNNGSHLLMPLLQEKQTEKATFQIILETAEQYSAVTNTPVQLNKIVAGKRLHLFTETGIILPSLLKIMVTDMPSSEPLSVDKSAMKDWKIYSKDENDRSKKNQYKEKALDIMEKLDKYFVQGIDLMSMDVLITSSYLIRESQEPRRFNGLLILSRDFDEDTIYRKICEAITFQLRLEKLEITKELWFIEGISRYLVQEILKQSDKLTVVEENDFENITSLIEESKRRTYRMEKANLPSNINPETLYKTGLSLMKMLAYKNDTFVKCLEDFLWMDDASVNYFMINYDRNNRKRLLTSSELDTNIAGYVARDMFTRIEQLTVPLLSVTLNSTTIHIQRVDAENGFHTKNGDSSEPMPIPIQIDFLVKTEEAQTVYLRKQQSNMLKTDSLVIESLDNFHCYTINRTFAAFKVIYDKPSWTRFGELAQVKGQLDEEKAFLISDITDIILENVNGEEELRNLEMTTAFQILQYFSKDDSYLIWLSLMKTMKRILPYLNGTELEKLFQTRVLQPHLNDFYKLHVQDFASMPEGHVDKQLKMLAIKLGRMVDVEPHRQLATDTLTKWRTNHFNNILLDSSIDREIFVEVAGTVIGLMEDSTEIESVAKQLQQHFSNTNDMTALQPLKYINKSNVKGSLCDSISEMVTAVDDKIESNPDDTLWIYQTNDRIEILFGYLMTGSQPNYDYGVHMFHTATKQKLYERNMDLYCLLLKTFVRQVRTEKEYDPIVEIVDDLIREGVIKSMPLVMVEAKERFEWRKHQQVFNNALKNVHV